MAQLKKARVRARKIAGKAGLVTASLLLVLATTPIAALADSSTQGQGGSTPPSMPSGGGQGGSQGGGSAPGGSGGSAPSGGGGANTMSFDYSGSYTGAVTADGTSVTSDGESYTASDSDENAALVENSGTLAMTNGTLSKSGDDTNGDNCNFYGLNSIFLAVGSGSTGYVSGTSLSATSEGSNGIFATDSGTVYAYKDTISTTAGNSRGLDATYDGTIVADSLDITTQGDHCASIATDRGGGNISVTNSTLSTAGSGSPLLYSTGDIEVSNCTGTATGSQIAGMEGLNTILIYNSTLSSTVTSKTASDPVADGVIIYQSTSGDAESTTGEAADFEAVDSTLSSSITSGAMFYLTNTTANIVLEGTTLDFDSSNADLLLASGNDSNNWGSAGSNGATVNFTGIGEKLSGNIVADTISSVGCYMLDGTTWTGAAQIEQNSSGSTDGSHLVVNVSSDSTWVVTADSTVDELNVEQGGKVVDSSGNAVTIVANGQTVQTGTSSLTVTVNDSYGTSFETSSANELTSPAVDRTGFDSYYSTSTEFGSGTVQQASAQATTTSSTAAASSTTAQPTSTQQTTTAQSHWYDVFVNIWNGIVGFFTGK